jgi:hypothetical protein
MFDRKKYMEEWQKNNREKYLGYHRKWRKNKNNKEKELEQCKQYNKNHKKQIKEYRKQYYIDNRKKELEWKKQWVKDNPEKVRINYNRYSKNRRKIDPKFRLDRNMGSMIWRGLKKKKNNKRWIEIVNYTIEALKKHLEKQFTPEMNWDNYGNYWEIDHIIPRSIFNYIKSEDIDFKKCWDLDNLQPLKASENRKKYNRIDKPFQPALLIQSKEMMIWMGLK